MACNGYSEASTKWLRAKFVLHEGDERPIKMQKEDPIPGNRAVFKLEKSRY